MPSKTFTLYRSSAGSGKTSTLVKEYLKLALRYKAGYFRHILAVTFTNRATQEMKERILLYLNDFIEGKQNPLAEDLRKELGLDDNEFQRNCQELRTEILHHYSQFSISTIDAFFQKVIRSFTRESELAGDYRLEADREAVLTEVIDNLMDDLGKDKEVTQWIIDFTLSNLGNDKPWDVRKGLIEFGKEIFSEEFKAIEDDLSKETDQKDYFRNLLKHLRTRKYEFVSFVKKKAGEAVGIIENAGFEDSDFKWGSAGAYSWLKKLTGYDSVDDFKEVGKRPDREYQLPANWVGKDAGNPGLLLSLAKEKLIPILNEILEYRNKNYEACLSAELVLNNFYSFGLIADIARKLKEYIAENNLMLLADAPKFLNGVIGKSDTPFIYEKVGSFYKNYLIDEFQDTSRMQWENFYPLVADSLDSGNKNFVVGDVKQAIYRWRGGDLTLLQQQVTKQIGEDRVETKNLLTNYRSAENIIQFNNALFAMAAGKIAEETDKKLSTEVYKEATQNVSIEDKGFVEIKFIEAEDQTFEEAALENLVTSIENLQLHGVPLKDMAILVRTNNEGQRIVLHLLEYKSSGLAKEGCRYDVISNESLRVDGAASVNLLLAAMRYLLNHDDSIARAELAFEYTRMHNPEASISEAFEVSNMNTFENLLPDSFTRQKISLKKLSLFELTETLILLLGLADREGELSYLLAFQDIVLNFYSRERNDLQAFLEWWEENKNTDATALKTSGEIDAAQILTIHKSKGLQFKYVFIPFCSWNFDHGGFQSPNLWVKSDKDIFKDAGIVPVKYSSTLENTFFADDYTKERTFSYLDNLNILYVAFTRAERGLFVSAPYPKNQNLSHVGQLTFACITSDEVLQKHWNNSTRIFRMGELKNNADKSERESDNVITLDRYLVSHWRDKLVIRQAGQRFFEPASDDSFQKIRHGIHIHTLLSRIRYPEDMNTAFEHLIADGLMATAEQESVKEELEALLKNPLIAPWFAKEWDVRTEVPILLPGGEENRIDRLLINKNKAVVIDYKTGKQSKEDQKQVQAYMDILRKMNFAEVEGYVLYISCIDVVEVNTGKAKSAKKKDDNQLDLGI